MSNIDFFLDSVIGYFLSVNCYDPNSPLLYLKKLPSKSFPALLSA